MRKEAARTTKYGVVLVAHTGFERLRTIVEGIVGSTT